MGPFVARFRSTTSVHPMISFHDFRSFDGMVYSICSFHDFVPFPFVPRFRSFHACVRSTISFFSQYVFCSMISFVPCFSIVVLFLLLIAVFTLPFCCCRCCCCRSCFVLRASRWRVHLQSAATAACEASLSSWSRGQPRPSWGTLAPERLR